MLTSPSNFDVEPKLLMEPTSAYAMHLAEVDANATARRLIKLAEGLFGPMTSPWNFCGVIFRDHPPHLFYYLDSTTVQISLSYRAISDSFQTDFQLAHEVCHLLYPSVEPDQPEIPQTTTLNEGISTFFSVIAVTAFHGKEMQRAAIENLANNSPKYYAAFQLVSELMNKDESAIRRIREIQPMINKVTVADLRTSGLALTEEEINALVAIF
jgi:hypothetical protein